MGLMAAVLKMCEQNKATPSRGHHWQQTWPSSCRLHGSRKPHQEYGRTIAQTTVDVDKQALHATAIATLVIDGRAELSHLVAKGADEQAQRATTVGTDEQAYRPSPKPPRSPTGVRA